MSELGFNVAQEVLKEDADVGRAAAKMLIVALDSAYNSVLAVRYDHKSSIRGLLTRRIVQLGAQQLYRRALHRQSGR